MKYEKGLFYAFIHENIKNTICEGGCRSNYRADNQGQKVVIAVMLWRAAQFLLHMHAGHHCVLGHCMAFHAPLSSPAS